MALSRPHDQQARVDAAFGPGCESHQRKEWVSVEESRVSPPEPNPRCGMFGGSLLSPTCHNSPPPECVIPQACSSRFPWKNSAALSFSSSVSVWIWVSGSPSSIWQWHELLNGECSQFYQRWIASWAFVKKRKKRVGWWYAKKTCVFPTAIKPLQEVQSSIMR